MPGGPYQDQTLVICALFNFYYLFFFPKISVFIAFFTLSERKQTNKNACNPKIEQNCVKYCERRERVRKHLDSDF